jgi:hypothetical protein
MGVLGQSRDQGAASVTPPMQGPVDKTGFFPNISAGFRQAIAGPHSTLVGQAISEKNLYDQIIRAVQAEGEQGEDTLDITAQPTKVRRPFRNPYVSQPWENILNPSYNPLSVFGGGDRAEKDQIWAAVQRIRQRKPDFLKAFPDQGSLEGYAVQQRQKQVAASSAITARATTAGSVGGFIGGMAGSVASLDPENVVGGGFGTAAGKTFARTLIRRSVEGAGANAAASLIGSPGQVADAQRLGEEMTPGDIGHQVAESAAIGAVFGGTHVAAPRVGEAVGKAARVVVGKVAENLPDPARNALVAASIRAGTVKDRELLHEWQRLHTPFGVVDSSTPDERAAAHTMVRDADNREVSPLHPEAAVHNENRLSAVAQSLGVDLSTSDLPSAAPVQHATVRTSGGRRPSSYEDGLHSAEGTGKNPDSSADGHFQFTEGTWLEYAPKVADTKGLSRAQILALRHDLPTAQKAERLFRGDNARYLRERGLEDSPGNLSLAHFLGKGDAARVLKAAPETPIERLVDPRSLASNRKVLEGKSASEVVAWAHKRIGASVDMPVARADAVGEADPLDAEDYSDVPYQRAEFKPDELPQPTPETHIEGEQWDPIQSGELLLWERENGERIIVDGNKRAAMAQRLYADDPSIRVPATILHEADGISEEMARAVGALKNVNLGKGSLEERAASLADMPEAAELLRAPEHQHQIEAVAQLPYERFGEVLNGRVDRIAAVNDDNNLPDTMNSLAFALKDKRPLSQIYEKGDVLSLDGRVGEVISANDKNLVMDFAGAREMVPRDHPLLQPATPDQWRLGGGVNREAITAGNGDRGPSREPLGEAGGRDASAASDQLLSDRNEPSLFDHAVSARDTAKAFDDPVGEGAKAQTEILDHDLQMDAEPTHLFDLPETGFRVSEEGEKPQPLADIMREAESDDLAAKALRDCLKGGGE